MTIRSPLKHQPHGCRRREPGEDFRPRSGQNRQAGDTDTGALKRVFKDRLGGQFSGSISETLAEVVRSTGNQQAASGRTKGGVDTARTQLHMIAGAEIWPSKSTSSPSSTRNSSSSDMGVQALIGAGYFQEIGPGARSAAISEVVPEQHRAINPAKSQIGQGADAAAWVGVMVRCGIIPPPEISRRLADHFIST